MLTLFEYNFYIKHLQKSLVQEKNQNNLYDTCLWRCFFFFFFLKWFEVMTRKLSKPLKWKLKVHTKDFPTFFLLNYHLPKTNRVSVFEWVHLPKNNPIFPWSWGKLQYSFLGQVFISKFILVTFQTWMVILHVLHVLYKCFSRYYLKFFQQEIAVTVATC